MWCFPFPDADMPLAAKSACVMLPNCPGAAAKAGALYLEPKELVLEPLLQLPNGDIRPDVEDAAFNTSVRATREDTVHMLQHSTLIHARTPLLHFSCRSDAASNHQ